MNSTKNKQSIKKKIIWIELLRIFACLGVIIMHVANHNMRHIKPTTFEYQTLNFYHGIVKWVVPCFIMISGLLYLNKSKNLTLKKLYLKNILPIASSYIFWSGIYSSYKLISQGDIEQLTILQCIKKIIVVAATESYFHLWYLPTLICILIIVPILKVVTDSDNDKKICEYIIITFIILKIIPNTILFSGFGHYEVMNTVIQKIQPDIVCSYIGYFILGHYLYEYTLNKKMEKIIFLLGPVSIVISILLCGYYSIKQNGYVAHFYNNFSVSAFLFCISIFIFFKNIVSKIKWNEKFNTIIYKFSSSTFGIYLIHALFRDSLKKYYHIDSQIMNPIISVILISIVIFILSYICVRVIKKIPYINRYIV